MRDSSTTSTATVQPPPSARFTPDTDSARFPASSSTNWRAVRSASATDSRPLPVADDEPSLIADLYGTGEQLVLDGGQLVVCQLAPAVRVLGRLQLGPQPLGVVQLPLSYVLHRAGQPHDALDRRQRQQHQATEDAHVT